jgi:hypothetical protein
MSYNLSAIYGKDDNPAERLKPRIEHGKERPKLKKPFDISEHEFSDSRVRISNICVSKIELAVDDCGIEHYMTQSKEDAIAIAKALGVTGEDLL